VDEMELRGNINSSIISDTGDESENNKIHDERRKWSDINVSLPILFCFFHGVELLMKAILFDLGIKYSKSHNLTDLLNQIKDLENPLLNKVSDCVTDILTNSPFKEHFRENNKSVDEFYHILKYAEDKKGNYTSIRTLLGNEEDGLNNFLILRSQIKLLRIEHANSRKALSNIL
tara:strand:+ start:1692 stop:2213 length:522 start_codon:yes stop_codon:yes gene_type:complete